MTRKGKLKVKVFVEGHSEVNYFKEFKTHTDSNIAYKEINLKGGGYSSHLKEVRKSSDLGYAAVFIVVDLDLLVNNSSEEKNFYKLLDYCKQKNKSGKIPYFILGSNQSFEYFECMHCPNYKSTPTESYIKRIFGYDSSNDFKSDSKKYEFLNSKGRTYQNAVVRMRRVKCFIENDISVTKKKMDYLIKHNNTSINEEALTHLHSNIYELFDLLSNN